SAKCATQLVQFVKSGFAPWSDHAAEPTKTHLFQGRTRDVFYPSVVAANAGGPSCARKFERNGWQPRMHLPCKIEARSHLDWGETVRQKAAEEIAGGEKPTDTEIRSCGVLSTSSLPRSLQPE